MNFKDIEKLFFKKSDEMEVMDTFGNSIVHTHTVQSSAFSEKRMDEINGLQYFWEDGIEGSHFETGGNFLDLNYCVSKCKMCGETKCVTCYTDCVKCDCDIELCDTCFGISQVENKSNLCETCMGTQTCKIVLNGKREYSVVGKIESLRFVIKGQGFDDGCILDISVPDPLSKTLVFKYLIS